MTADSGSIIARLAAVIAERDRQRPAGSYTVELLEGGHPVLASKLIEEAYELVNAGAEAEENPSAAQDVAHEAADVLFHLLVFLQAQGIEWRMVERELTDRFGVSGLTEKAARPQDPHR